MTPRFIAHRFGRAYGPDSSRQALRAALSQPLHGLETDCCLTADGDIVLIHEARLAASVTLDGWADERTLAEIQAAVLLDASGEPTAEHPLSLAELLEPAPPVELLQLEVKATADAALARRTARELCARIAGRPGVEVISFWPDACRIAAEHGLPSRLIVACAYLPRELAAWATATGISGVILEGSYFDPDVVGAWREAGLSIASGVVNDATLLRRVLAFEPDAVATDRPHELRAELERGA